MMRDGAEGLGGLEMGIGVIQRDGGAGGCDGDGGAGASFSALLQGRALWDGDWK